MTMAPTAHVTTAPPRSGITWKQKGKQALADLAAEKEAHNETKDIAARKLKNAADAKAYCDNRRVHPREGT
jgi:hypothetical protein